MMIRCAIVDDEFLARQYLSDYVSKIPFLELVGDFNSPLKVIDLIKCGQIDLLFLDIEMPDITGLDFLRTLDKQPLVIFTTAYKEYALEGYELNVSDYLLKPFSFERFLKAINKVSEALEGQPNKLTEEQAAPMLYDDYLTIRADRKHYKINYEDLIYIEGQKAYVTFHTTNKKITALASLKDLEEKLPAKQFIRIHKSFIVSIKHIDALDGNLIEINKNQLPVGKSYRLAVEKVFGIG
ncbi:MAG: LytR/AlgR family response regulator transcription factor [Prolixibacteraceae bacterium]